MEIAAASAAVNALRVGVNIAVGRNRPIIEFYYELRNDFGPVQNIPGREIMKGVKVSYRASPAEHLRFNFCG
jgi:hypothetical protein